MRIREILEPFGNGPGASLQRPLGEHGAEVGGAEDARVLVEGDVLAARAGFLHLVESLLDRPVAVRRQPGHGGDVRDLQRDPRRRRGPDRLGDGLPGLPRPVSGVGGVEAARLPGHAAQGRHLLFAGSLLAVVLQPRGVSERPFLQGLGEPLLHLSQLSRVGGAIRQAQGGQAKVAVGGQRGDVEGRLEGLQVIQVLGHGLPGDAQRGLVAVDVAGRQLHALHRRAAMAAVSDHLQGHPLADGADRPRVHHQRVVGVAVDVDEAGRYIEARGVDPGDAATDPRLPTSEILPWETATSPVLGGAPVPSSRVPLAMISSGGIVGSDKT